VSDDKQHDQQHDDENLEAGGYGAKVSIPKWAGAYIGPYLKYGVVVAGVGFGVGLFVVLVCYGLSLVMR
jgi:hypothetical protein